MNFLQMPFQTRFKFTENRVAGRRSRTMFFMREIEIRITIRLFPSIRHVVRRSMFATLGKAVIMWRFEFNSRKLKQCTLQKGNLISPYTQCCCCGEYTIIICCKVKRKCWMIWFYCYISHVSTKSVQNSNSEFKVNVLKIHAFVFQKTSYQNEKDSRSTLPKYFLHLSFVCSIIDCILRTAESN